MFGTNELLIIALVVFVLFGASAIPKFAKALKQAKTEFEKKEDTKTIKNDEETKSS